MRKGRQRAEAREPLRGAQRPESERELKMRIEIEITADWEKGFFFFFEFWLESAGFSRYGPSRRELAGVCTASVRVVKKKKKNLDMTPTRWQRRPSRIVMSDASATPLATRPCFPLDNTMCSSMISGQIYHI